MLSKPTWLLGKTLWAAWGWGAPTWDMLAAVEDVVVCLTGYLGVRLGDHGRGAGGEAGITSVGEGGGSGVEG